MKILVINGPNLNFLGIRETNIYGQKSYKELCVEIEKYCEEKAIDVQIFQSNHEGDIVDAIQKAYFEKVNGIVINAGGYSHYSVAIHDAIKATKIPTICVHISDTLKREEFRKQDIVGESCVKVIKGHGIVGYVEAICDLEKLLNNSLN